MRCPSCGSEDVRAGELLELHYDVDDDGEPGDLLNAEHVFEAPGDVHLVCLECFHRWERDGSPFDMASRVRRMA